MVELAQGVQAERERAIEPQDNHPRRFVAESANGSHERHAVPDVGIASMNPRFSACVGPTRRA